MCGLFMCVCVYCVRIAFVCMMSLYDWSKSKLQSLLVLINCKWQSGGNAATGKERARDNQRTELTKGEQIEKHNEGRTENTSKCNLQRKEDQSLSEMD